MSVTVHGQCSECGVVGIQSTMCDACWQHMTKQNAKDNAARAIRDAHAAGYRLAVDDIRQWLVRSALDDSPSVLAGLIGNGAHVGAAKKGAT